MRDPGAKAGKNIPRITPSLTYKIDLLHGLAILVSIVADRRLRIFVAEVQ